jgi:hypothetical protein
MAVSDDWNSDGLNDNWDEAHEFGIDLDGGGGGVPSEDGSPADGFDLGALAVFDAADLLGADLVQAVGPLGDVADPFGAGASVALPVGEELVAMLADLGDRGLEPDVLLAFVAGLSIRNPFHPADG